MGIVKKFLEKLAAANKEELGTSRLDCCDLNQAKKTTKKPSKKD